MTVQVSKGGSKQIHCFIFQIYMIFKFLTLALSANELYISIQIKIKLRPFKSSEHINGPYRGFGYLSLFCDPLDLANVAKENYCN